MKLKTTFIKLPLTALLSMGLVCAPLAVNADDDKRGWRGQYQQDHGRHDYRAERRSDRHDYVYHKTHGHRDSCRTNYKHRHKKGRHKYRSQVHGSHYTQLQPLYRDGYPHERTLLFPGSYFGNLAVLYYD